MALNSDLKRAKISARLRSIMDSYGISQSDLSRASGISRSSICRYLAGDVAPSYRSAVRLAEALQVSAEWLMGSDDIYSVNALTEIYNALDEQGRKRLLGYAGSLFSLSKNADDKSSEEDV